MYRYVIFFSLILFSACEKEVDLFQVEKDKIEREWQVESLVETFESGNLINSESNIFIANFRGDETVALTFPERGNIVQTSIWYYQLQPERVIIVNNESQFGQLLVPNDYFSVLEKTENRQIWQFESTNGVNITVKTWTLTSS